jgi:Sulfate permease family
VCRLIPPTLRGYRRSWLGPDVLAGLTLAAIAVPEQVATARLVGMPAITGLYAFLAGSLLFAMLGRGRQLSIGADSTIAPVLVASQCARSGMSALAVEQHLVGGERPYWGCVPSKAMVRAAQVLAEAWRVDELAGTSSADPEWAVVARRVNEVSDGWDDTRAAERLAKTGAALLRGRGIITGAGEVRVGDQSFAARAGLVVATGTEPAIPAVDGLSGVPY